MGRFFGWVGPVAYLVTVALVAACGYCLVFSGAAADYGVIGFQGGVPVYGWNYTANPLRDLGELLVFTPLGWGPVLVWFAALLWFVGQAGVAHANKAEDERWTAHMLSVGFVGRLVLVPLNVLLTLSALGAVATFLVAPGPAGNLGLLNFGLWLELFNVMLALPFAVYQMCGATRLANRGLMRTTPLVWHTVLSFLPTVGFVSMCALFVNGRAVLWDAHDRRVAREAVAAAAGAGDAEKGAEGEDATTEAKADGTTAKPEEDAAAVAVEGTSAACGTLALAAGTPVEPTADHADGGEGAAEAAAEGKRGGDGAEAEPEDGAPEAAEGAGAPAAEPAGEPTEPAEPAAAGTPAKDGEEDAEPRV